MSATLKFSALVIGSTAAAGGIAAAAAAKALIRSLTH